MRSKRGYKQLTHSGQHKEKVASDPKSNAYLPTRPRSAPTRPTRLMLGWTLPRRLNDLCVPCGTADKRETHAGTGACNGTSRVTTIEKGRPRTKLENRKASVRVDSRFARSTLVSRNADC
jgi:hypothetical protein